MCANYVPVTRVERLTAYFAAGNPAPFPAESYPGSPAPFVRRAGDGANFGRELELGLFGLLPHWAKDPGFARRTYNARSETAAEKPSFRDAWARGRRCIVPCEAIFEPRWEGGRAVRWRIARRDAAPIGIAGLWSAWPAPDGGRLLSFTMLTVNADAHALMRQFHRPEDEKRMVAMLEFDRFDDWLNASPQHMRELLGGFSADTLHAEPAPRARPGRAVTRAPVQASRPASPSNPSSGQREAAAPPAEPVPQSPGNIRAPRTRGAAPKASEPTLPLFPETD